MSAQQACTAELPEIRGTHGLRASQAKGVQRPLPQLPLQNVQKPAKTGLTEYAGHWDHEAGAQTPETSRR